MDFDFVHTAFVGGAAALANYVLYGSSNVNLMGFNLSSPVAAAIAVGGSNIVVQAIDKKYPLSQELPISQAYRDDVGMYMVPLATGVTSHLAVKYGFGYDTPFTTNVLIGAGSQYVGSLAGDKFSKSSPSGTI